MMVNAMTVGTMIANQILNAFDISACSLGGSRIPAVVRQPSPDLPRQLLWQFDDLLLPSRWRHRCPDASL
jgi:hypothetical protein